MDAEPGEGQVDHGRGRLGGVPLTAAVGREGVPDLGLAVDSLVQHSPTLPATVPARAPLLPAPVSPSATTSTARSIHTPGAVIPLPSPASLTAAWARSIGSS